MGRIRGKNTGPELAVRRLAHRMGYRFRLHRRELPGRPDIVFASYRKVVLVHGCFWHRHPGCRFAYVPKSNAEFWHEKFDSNVERDARTLGQLTDLGWRSLVVWECETDDRSGLAGRLSEFLGPTGTGRPRTPCYGSAAAGPQSDDAVDAQIEAAAT